MLLTGMRGIRVWILAAGWAVNCMAQPRGPAGAAFNDRIFEFYHEFFGPQAYTNPEASLNIRNRMANGVSLQPPFDAGLADFVRSRGVNLMVDPASRLRKDFMPSAALAQQRAIEELAGREGIRKVVWNVMPEWDQAGGEWVPEGRPRYANFTREQAYARFAGFYAANYPAMKIAFGRPSAERNYWTAAITDFSPNTFHAYEMGADICLLERSIDELGDISTGIAFTRGAGRQYDRHWGIDISTYRTSNDMATKFDDRETLLGGWSPSYLKRHYFIAYMAGAHMIRNEATGYYKNGSQLDPLGRVTREFADFALTRHPEVDRASVTTALMISRNAGFDPKHWLYLQQDAVWYQDLPYSDGDRMINQFFRLAYPNHWLHGLTPGAPFNDAAGHPDKRGFQSYLARGGDPRPFEPMATTRYGHSLDILNDHAPGEALRHYKVIILLGDVAIDARMREALAGWVEAGGTLVTTAGQNTGFDESFLGLRLEGVRQRGTTSTWIADGRPTRESPFWFLPVSLTTASIVASADDGAPLITSNPIGGGRVIVATAPYLQNAAHDQMLSVGTRLFDWLAEQHATARIEGSPVEYLVNESASRVTVTVVNDSGEPWTGAVVMPDRGEVVSARELIGEIDLRWTRTTEGIRATGVVPAYDVKVFSIDFGPR